MVRSYIPEITVLNPCVCMCVCKRREQERNVRKCIYLQKREEKQEEKSSCRFLRVCCAAVVDVVKTCIRIAGLLLLLCYIRVGPNLTI